MVNRFGDSVSGSAVPQCWNFVWEKTIVEDFNSLPAKGFETTKTMKTRGGVIIYYCESQSRKEREGFFVVCCDP